MLNTLLKSEKILKLTTSNFETKLKKQLLNKNLKFTNGIEVINNTISNTFVAVFNNFLEVAEFTVSSNRMGNTYFSQVTIRNKQIIEILFTIDVVSGDDDRFQIINILFSF